MEKLSKEEISRVKNVLTDFIQKTAGEEDTDKLHKLATQIMGPEFCDNPSLIKQAASAYNSNKSMFKLSNEETANTDFGLLNPNALYEELSNNLRAKAFEKSASAYNVVTFSTTQTTMNKVASAPESEQKTVAEEVQPMSQLEFSNYMKDVLDNCCSSLNKLASRRELCAFDEIEARERFCRNFKFLSKEAKRKVAKHLVDTYREEGQRLLDIYNDTVDSFDKIANVTPSAGIKSYNNFPKGDIYTQAEDAICAHYVEKQASAVLDKSCEDVVSLLKGIPGLYTIHKKASAGSFLKYVGGGTIADPIVDALSPHPSADVDVLESVVSRKLLGELRELEVRNVLVDMYSEPFIASYPAADIEAATIRALQMLPLDQRKHPRRHTTLLKTWVADILGRGGNLSASDTDKILKAEEVSSKRRIPDMVYKAPELY